MFACSRPLTSVRPPHQPLTWDRAHSSSPSPRSAPHISPLIYPSSIPRRATPFQVGRRLRRASVRAARRTHALPAPPSHPGPSITRNVSTGHLSHPLIPLGSENSLRLHRIRALRRAPIRRTNTCSGSLDHILFRNERVHALSVEPPRRDATRRDASEMAVPPAGDGNALLSPGPAPEADNNHSESHGCSSQHHEQFIAILFPYVRGLSACVHAVLCAGASVVVVAAAGRTIPRARVSCARKV